MAARPIGRELDLLVEEPTKAEKIRATKRAWAERNLEKYREYRRKYNRKYKDSPEKIRARELIGYAIRRGFIEPPERSRTWHNKWHFHHPDYSRPYFGCWLTIVDHSAVHKGKIECPPCTDYEAVVRMGILKEWDLL